MPTVRPRSGASFYPFRRPAVAVVLALTAAGLAIAAPTASATVWRAAADDPVDAGLSEGRDVVRVELTYDDVAGTASTTIVLRGVPTGDRAFALVLGRKDGAGVCGSPALALVSVAVGGGTGGSWKLLDAGGGEVASGNEVVLQENASSVTVSGASPAFAGGVYDCAEVQTLDASMGGGTVRDTVTFSALAADPSSVPPAPPTPPSPGPTPPAPPAPTSPVPKKAPALRVTTTGLPKTVVRGRSYRVTVRVDNVGTAAAKQLRLSVARTPGVRATPTRAVWKRLSAGKGVTRRVTVRATTTRTRMLRLRVTGRGKLSATATLRVVPKIAQRKTAPTKRKTPAKATPAKATPAKATPAKAPLAGRYFWGFKTQLDRGWDNYAVLFVDDRWAYVGFPEDGVPTCTAAVAEGDGCRRYTLDAKSGALKVGEFEGTWKDESGGSLTFDGLRMSELAFAKPGTRYALSLQHKNFSGQCGFTTGCTTWSRSFALNAEGHFVSSGSSVSSLGGSGTPYVWSGAFPSDETGSYEILTRGRIRLSYLNGKVEVFTLGLELDKQGLPAPATNGLLLGSTNFYD